MYQVKVGGTAQNCAPVEAWLGKDDEHFTVTVREGFLTFASVRCSVPP